MTWGNSSHRFVGVGACGRGAGGAVASPPNTSAQPGAACAGGRVRQGAAAELRSGSGLAASWSGFAFSAGVGPVSVEVRGSESCRVVVGVGVVVVAVVGVVVGAGVRVVVGAAAAVVVAPGPRAARPLAIRTTHQAPSPLAPLVSS